MSDLLSKRRKNGKRVKSEVGEETLNLEHNCVQIQPEIALKNSGNSKEKSTERVGMRISDISSKLCQLRGLISTRLSFISLPSNAVFSKETDSILFNSSYEPIKIDEKEIEENVDLSQIFPSMRHSPSLSSVPAASYGEDWTVSFLSLSRVPTPPAIYHSIRVPRNSGDEDPVGSESGETGVRPRERKGWRRVLMCACWRRKKTR